MTKTSTKPKYGELYREQADLTLTLRHTEKYLKGHNKRWEVDARRYIAKCIKLLIDIIGSLPEEYFDYIGDDNTKGYAMATTNLVFSKQKMHDEQLVPCCQIFTPANYMFIFVKDNVPVIYESSEVCGFRHFIDDFDALPAEHIMFLYDRILTALGVARLLSYIDEKGTK